MSEKAITNSIIKGINKLPGCLARKRYSSGSTNTSGHPDITGSVYGVRLEIEVKQPGKKPTKLQYSKIRMYQRLGCIAFWTDNKEKALGEIAYLSKSLKGKHECFIISHSEQ